MLPPCFLSLLYLWHVLSPFCLFFSFILISLRWTDQKDSGYPSMFLIDSSATLIISSFFLARSLLHTFFFLPFVICCHLLTFSLLSLVFSLLYSPLLPLTLSSFYPNHEKILEQRKKGWSIQPLSVRWFIYIYLLFF